MQNFPNKKDRLIVLALWFVFFLTAVCDSLFLLVFQDVYTISVAIISIPVTIFLTILVGKVSKGFFLKYYFNKKKFNELYDKSVVKFEGASESFLKEFKLRTHNQYLLTGDIYYYPSIDDDKWLLSDKDSMMGLTMLINMLDSTISEGKGVVSFIKDSYALTHNGDLVIGTLSNGFLSGELRYLLLKVYEETGFNLEDNELREEYTKKINELKDKIDKEYTHLLYNFDNEISLIKAKLNKDTSETYLN